MIQRNQSIEYKKRLEDLKKIKKIIEIHKESIYEALFEDLGKSPAEAHLAEVSFILKELDFFIKNLKSWMKVKKVPTPGILWPAQSFVYSEPHGRVLIFSAWNYPFQLALSPWIGAVAAGNSVTLKLSEKAPATARVIDSLFASEFSSEDLQIVQGGVDVAQNLLKEKWDFIFFTGSSSVGKLISKAAAENLTPVCLELGGKSPCIVEADANLEVSVRRILWGKFLNLGQTCIAPDYVLIHSSIYKEFLELAKKTIQEFYDSGKSLQYGKVINSSQYEKLLGLLESAEILVGGECDKEKLKISPTLIGGDLNHASMKDEIFGPILPIFTFNESQEALSFVRNFEKPLALYIFAESDKKQKLYIQNLDFGGGCVNDTLLHIANPHLPFGGVGPSGFGRYHGKSSFDLFSYQKSVLKRSFLGDWKFRYPPYSKKVERLIKKF